MKDIWDMLHLLGLNISEPIIVDRGVLRLVRAFSLVSVTIDNFTAQVNTYYYYDHYLYRNDVTDIWYSRYTPTTYNIGMKETLAPELIKKVRQFLQAILLEYT